MDELFDNIYNMSNEQAATILLRLLKAYRPARHCGKTMLVMSEKMALAKAIDLLLATPDKKEE